MITDVMVKGGLVARAIASRYDLPFEVLTVTTLVRLTYPCEMRSDILSRGVQTVASNILSPSIPRVAAAVS
jgi:hypothetical protein